MHLTMRILLASGLIAGTIGVAANLPGEPAKITELAVGITPNLLAEKTAKQETTARDSLTKFIKSETGFDNVVTTVPTYEELAAQLDKGTKHIGVFSGFEYAWAQEQYPGLKPLALAINEYPNRYVHMVGRNDQAAKDFAGLAGQTLIVPRNDAGYALRFVDRQSQLAGKATKDFFSRIAVADSQEIALDDVVDGVAQVAAVDRVALTAYKRRKPGRFDMLKEVAHSPALPSPVIAYRDGILDKQTLQRFQNGLIDAANNSDGRSLLTLSRLTSFTATPANFSEQLAQLRQAFPAPGK